MSVGEREDWRGYLAAFHAHRPGVTERVFARLDDDPYEWVTAPLRELGSGLVVDLACGSAPTRPWLRERRWVGVDHSAEELAAAAGAGRGPLVRARADALPVATGAAGAVCAAMALPLPVVLDEIRRVLRPGGALVALVPARIGLDPAGWFAWLRVLRAAGVPAPRWPNPRAREHLGGVLDRAGFEVLDSERRVFSFPLQSPEDAAVLLESLYDPARPPSRPTDPRVAAAVAESVRALPMPLRRIVARPQARVPSHVVSP
ncbi:methyltransferase domain-containing protein [Actinopolyspora alba]|uniref:methyltransferase domain-containing protein n=1 Tax=Actinopolyspora alba TaxID=673379 RepID=UPI001FE049F2|nr:methyltransferase domain-containing protein [Actinopolyspora alba]